MLNIWILPLLRYIELISIIFVVYCLQRISIGYLLASITEIWLVRNVMVDSPTAFVQKYYIQWLENTINVEMFVEIYTFGYFYLKAIRWQNFYLYFYCRIVATLLLSVYMCLLYGLYVPNWEFQSSSLTLSTNGPHTQIVSCTLWHCQDYTMKCL